MSTRAADPPIRVLVVDDQMMARRGIAALLEDSGRVEVIGEADSGVSAVALAQELQPDVVVMDVRMPDGDGIQATRELSALPHPIPVLLITTFDLDDYVREGLAAGASGFLLKSCTPAELALGVSAAAQGVQHIDSALILRALAPAPAIDPPARAAAGKAPSRGAAVGGGGSDDAVALLTRRDREVLQALSTGATNEEIARSLGVALGTVKTYMYRLQEKTKVTGRAGLVAWSFRNGVIR